jgi:integrase
MPRNALPAYRFFKPRNLAFVDVAGKRHYLGPYGSPESREKYDRIIAEYLASNRNPVPETTETTVADLILAFMDHANVHYRRRDGTPTREADNFREALKPVLRIYGETPARNFKALALRTVRDGMIRSGLARTTINARVNKIRHAFRWAVSFEMIPSDVIHSLESLDGLRDSRSEAREPDKIKPVPVEAVEATLPHMPAMAAIMVRLQLLTGMRVGDVLRMSGDEITENWEYKPTHHKNTHRGHTRTIVLGPKSQEILKPILTSGPLFPYDRRTYRQAIVRACKKAKVADWTPLQLRHTFGTRVRAEFGLEASQAALGHAKADVTQRYAECNVSLAYNVASSIG